jgi:hypothetical protein
VALTGLLPYSGARDRGQARADERQDDPDDHEHDERRPPSPPHQLVRAAQRREAAPALDDVGREGDAQRHQEVDARDDERQDAEEDGDRDEHPDKDQSRQVTCRERHRRARIRPAAEVRVAVHADQRAAQDLQHDEHLDHDLDHERGVVGIGRAAERVQAAVVHERIGRQQREVDHGEDHLDDEKDRDRDQPDRLRVQRVQADRTANDPHHPERAKREGPRPSLHARTR